MKTIIKVEPEWNNSHCYLENVDYDLPGWRSLPEEFEEIWNENKPFVQIETGEDGSIINMVPCEEIKAPPKLNNKPLTELQRDYALQLFVLSLEDESDMLQVSSLYPEYKIGTAYKIGDKFKYGTNSVGDPQLYQVLQPHTSAEEWTPDTATSLYKKIGVSDDGIPIWVQPLGATDAYQIGDIVLYNGKKYESLINANAWSPDAYPAGWKLLDETEPTEPSDPDNPEEDIPEWVQPTGTHDAYNTGDIVMYNGKKYESTIDGNVWAPDAYPDGWSLVE